MAWFVLRRTTRLGDGLMYGYIIQKKFILVEEWNECQRLGRFGNTGPKFVSRLLSHGNK